MDKFIEIPATARSMVNRKLSYGLGINDAEYIIEIKVDGKKITCPFYKAWSNMLARCYSKAVHERYPNYFGCAVTSEWLIFSNFKGWMTQQDWVGNHLDKDILHPYNKEYSPEHCAFISPQVNNLLNNHAASRGQHPQGVYWCKNSRSYRSSIRIHGKLRNLGYYSTPEAASIAYKAAKKTHIIDVARTQEHRVRAGLLRHAEIIGEY